MEVVASLSRLWLLSLKVAQLLRSAACLHTNQSRSYLNHLVVVFEWSVLGVTELTRGDVISEARRQYTAKICPALSLFLICFDREWKVQQETGEIVLD